MLWLETERQGLLSEATAIVLCQDLDVVADVRSMDNSILLRQMPRDEVESLLVDIGMVLQYAAFTEKQSNLPSEQGHCPLSTLGPKGAESESVGSKCMPD